MASLIYFLNHIASWKTWLLLLILYVSFPAYWLKNAETTINRLANKPIGPIDLTIDYNPARTRQMIADYGPAARAYYAHTELTTDLIYPLVYSLLLAVTLTLLFQTKSYKSAEKITLLPFVVLLFDFLENAMIVSMLVDYPTQSPVLVSLCEVFKLIKWLSFGLTILLVLYGLFQLLMSKIQTNLY
jgi:hypothetical protein